MSRLAACFAGIAAAGRKALVTFVTAGDPSLDATVPAMHSLVAGGADVLELGIPFSDPEAEGPTIQAASERSLARGTTLLGVLRTVEAFRATNADTPVVLMGYLNSVLAMGVENFAARAGKAGVDGLIMVNLPPEEAEAIKPALAGQGIDLIFLVAPTTTDARARYIVGQASGFVYYVSLKGTTGAGGLDVAAVAERVSWLKEHTPLPVMVGFGIRDGETARAVAQHADGAVVGSALVSTMAAYVDRPEALDELTRRLTEQVREIRAGLDRLMAAPSARI